MRRALAVILPAVNSLEPRCALVALLAAIALAPAAGASPASDSAAVIKDYGHDRNITSCRFKQSQLKNALAGITPDVDTYAPGFRKEVNAELKRWKDGGCKKKRGAIDVRIVAIKARGGAKSESVTLRNYGSKTVNLSRYVLRDASDHTIRLGKTTLKKHARLRVVTGCRTGRRSAFRKGSTYYACRGTEFWNDAGDVVELDAPTGGLLSRKKYGTPPA
ncbi:MAG: hypothetical protein QOJ63_132 [Solirubrobacteraceae bacterium]|jgi:hypothetical protein|nr:hypothetical protein [Solirubrobacteraceae bacterium]